MFEFLGLLIPLVSCRSRSSMISQYSSLYESDILSRELLDSETDGKCIDGSPAAYYLRISVSGKKQTDTRRDKLSDNWILYLEGGCWCYNDIDCYLRSFEDLGSSKNYERFLPDRFGGLLSKSSNLNYPFSTYNLVYIKYCDGNTFAGDRDGPVYVNNRPLYFRGKKIKERVLESLVEKTHFYDAENIIVTGCSAGGLSSLIQVDSIADWAQINLRNGSKVDVASVPISGYFIDTPNIHKDHVFRNQMIESYLLTNATSGLHQSCIRERASIKPKNIVNIPLYSRIFSSLPIEEKNKLLDNDTWRCNFAEYSFPHSKTRTFILNSAIDSYQRDCVLSAMPVSLDHLDRIRRLTAKKGDALQKTCDILNKYLNVNGNCSAAEGFRHCGIDLTDCPVNKFSPLVHFQKIFLNRTLQAMNLSSNKLNSDGFIIPRDNLPSVERQCHNGAFLTSCVTHCEGKRDSSWNTIKIDGVSIRDAVLEWYFYTSKNKESLKPFYFEENGEIVLNDVHKTKILSPKTNRVYIDCILSAEDYDECNPTCIQ